MYDSSKLVHLSWRCEDVIMTPDTTSHVDFLDMMVENSIFSTNIPQIFFDGPLAGWKGFPMAQVLPPKKLNFCKKNAQTFGDFFPKKLKSIFLETMKS